jgi:hypothetical protein
MAMKAGPKNTSIKFNMFLQAEEKVVCGCFVPIVTNIVENSWILTKRL